MKMYEMNYLQFILQIIFGSILNIYHWPSDVIRHHDRFRDFLLLF